MLGALYRPFKFYKKIFYFFSFTVIFLNFFGVQSYLEFLRNFEQLLIFAFFSILFHLFRNFEQKTAF